MTISHSQTVYGIHTSHYERGSLAGTDLDIEYVVADGKTIMVRNLASYSPDIGVTNGIPTSKIYDVTI